MKVSEKIKRCIAKRKGNIIFKSDLAKFGEASTISRCLKQLCEEKKLLRISRGIYAKARPEEFNFRGKEILAVPYVDSMTLYMEVLDRLGVTYELCEAARDNFGGSTQMPAVCALEVFSSRITRRLSAGGGGLVYERKFKKPEDIVWRKWIPDDNDIYGETYSVDLASPPSYSLVFSKKEKMNE